MAEHEDGHIINTSKTKLILHLEREIVDYEDFSLHGGFIEPAEVLREFLDKVETGFFD